MFGSLPQHHVPKMSSGDDSGEEGHDIMGVSMKTRQTKRSNRKRPITTLTASKSQPTIQGKENVPLSPAQSLPDVDEGLAFFCVEILPHLLKIESLPISNQIELGVTCTESHQGNQLTERDLNNITKTLFGYLVKYEIMTCEDSTIGSSEANRLMRTLVNTVCCALRFELPRPSLVYATFSQYQREMSSSENYIESVTEKSKGTIAQTCKILVELLQTHSVSDTLKYYPLELLHKLRAAITKCKDASGGSEPIESCR